MQLQRYLTGHLAFTTLSFLSLAFFFPSDALSSSKVSRENFDQISDQLSEKHTKKEFPTLSSSAVSVRFLDLQNHWARPFVEGLAAHNLMRNLFSSSPNNKFQPDQSITRAELAVILHLTFIYQAKYRSWSGFADIPADHWAATEIQKVYEGSLMSGFSDRTFRPKDYVTRSQAMTAIANGLQLITDPKRTNRTFLLSMYEDANLVPDYAVLAIAALSDRQLVVNYPQPRSLNPNRNINRGELAALLYQVLVYQKQAPQIASQYIADPSKPLFDAAAGQVTRLEVNLSQRRVTAFQGETKLKSYPIAVGRRGWETPTGKYRVQQMIERPAWKNPFTGDVIKSGDPDNPLGHYWIGFWTNGKDWSGFHGTPNRESVGQAVSHGCIRMYNEDIKELFRKVTPATVVRVSH